MNYWQIAMTGMGVYTAGVGIAMGYMAWRDRRRKPPLPQRTPTAAEKIARVRKALAGERAARIAMSMPQRHPELITRALPGGDEEWLDRLCRDLWPHDEYVREIHNARYREQP